MLSVIDRNRIRRIVLPQLHPMDGYIGRDIIPPRGEPRHLIRERGDHCTLSVKCGLHELILALRKYGYVANSLATLKYIVRNDEKVWEEMSMAYRKSRSDKWMHHAFAFPASEESEYTYIVGHHKEVNYWHSMSGHTSGPRFGGDPDGHLKSALDESDIKYDLC